MYRGGGVAPESQVTPGAFLVSEVMYTTQKNNIFLQKQLFVGVFQHNYVCNCFCYSIMHTKPLCLFK